MSATTSTTLRPGCGVEPPYPGRDVVTSRSPRACTARSIARTGVAAPGVPW